MMEWIIGGAALALLGLFLLYNNFFVVRPYQLKTEKLDKAVKIILISDLHNKRYGKKNERVLNVIRKRNPDFIVIAGDLVDKRKPNIPVGVAFAEGCADIAPTFYISGNHENERGNFDEIASQMKKTRVLRNEWTEIAGVKLLGLLDHFEASDVEQKKALAAFEREDGYKIVAIHRPIAFFAEEQIRERNVDLQLSGHTHGGVAHLPFYGAIFAPGEGFFPKYAQGMYNENGTTLVVSGGLGNTRLPIRLFNFPEFLEISINPKKMLAK